MGNSSGKDNDHSAVHAKSGHKKFSKKSGARSSREENQPSQTSQVDGPSASSIVCQPSDAPREANHRPPSIFPAENREQTQADVRTTQYEALNFVDAHFGNGSSTFTTYREQTGGASGVVEGENLQSNARPLTGAAWQPGRSSRSSTYGSRASLLSRVDERTYLDVQREIQARVPPARQYDRYRSPSVDDLLHEQANVGIVNSNAVDSSMSSDSYDYTLSSGTHSYSSSTYGAPPSSRSVRSRPSTAPSDGYSLPNSIPTEATGRTSSATPQYSVRPGNAAQIPTGRNHRNIQDGHGHARSMSMSVSQLNGFGYGDGWQRGVPGGQVELLRQHDISKSCEELDNPHDHHIRRLSEDMRTLSREFIHLSNKHLALSISHQKLAQKCEEQEEVLIKIRAPENNIQDRS